MSPASLTSSFTESPAPSPCSVDPVALSLHVPFPGGLSLPLTLPQCKSLGPWVWPAPQGLDGGGVSECQGCGG